MCLKKVPRIKIKRNVLKLKIFQKYKFYFKINKKYKKLNGKIYLKILIIMSILSLKINYVY